MGRPKKLEGLDPIHYCLARGEQLIRKTFKGRMEDRNVFLRRPYCNRKCMAKAFVKDTPSRSALRKRVTPYRGKSCESCGAMRNLRAHHIDGNLLNDLPANIQTLRGSCHISRHHRAQRAGLTVAGKLDCHESQ